MKTTVVTLALLASADAFAPAFINKQIAVTRVAMADDDEPDYDAPLERRMAVGNIVRSDDEAPSFIPKFLQNLFNKDEGGSSTIKRASPTAMDMDDECYMGKDGDAEDCVDFDPPVTP